MEDVSNSAAPIRPRTPSPRRNEVITVLPTGVGQPVGKKRRYLAFSNEVDIDERRRRKRLATSEEAATDRPAEAASSSSGSTSVHTLAPQAESREDTADGIFNIGGGEEGDAEAEGSGTVMGTPCSSSPFHVNAEETSLTQLFEEGLENAAADSDDDLL